MTYPDPLPEDAILYHWAPTTRRKGIARYGLQSGKPSVLMPRFRPPFVCFGLNPASAWEMSGINHPHVPEWDLWAANSSTFEDVFEVLPYDDMTPKEVRLYGRVPAADLWYVGTRRQALDARGREVKP